MHIHISTSNILENPFYCVLASITYHPLYFSLSLMLGKIRSPSED